MRALLLLGVLTVAGLGLAIRHLPEEARAAGAPAGDRQRVQAIEVDGGRKLPRAALRAAVTTKVGDQVDTRQLERDRAAIEAELEARGHLAAKVSPASVTYGPHGGAYIVFDVEPGPLYRLRSVTVTGPGQRDADVVRLAVGDEARRDRLVRARQALADTFSRRGGKQVELLVSTDAEAAVLDVELATK